MLTFLTNLSFLDIFITFFGGMKVTINGISYIQNKEMLKSLFKFYAQVRN